METIGDHGNEFGVCGLALRGIHRIAKVFLQRFQVAAVPRHLYLYVRKKGAEGRLFYTYMILPVHAYDIFRPPAGTGSP